MQTILKPSQERENYVFEENETVLGELGMWLYEFTMDWMDVAYDETIERPYDDFTKNKNTLQMLLIAAHEILNKGIAPAQQKDILKTIQSNHLANTLKLKIEACIQLDNNDKSMNKFKIYNANALVNETILLYEYAQDLALSWQDKYALVSSVNNIQNGNFKTSLQNIQQLLKLKQLLNTF